MKKTYDIAVIPGDGTGPEVVAEGIKVLEAVANRCNFGLPTDVISVFSSRITISAVTIIWPPEKPYPINRLIHSPKKMPFF
jgi:isocitrate/isopropylmalate dehydrogenase